jgi:hypothetical protein
VRQSLAMIVNALVKARLTDPGLMQDIAGVVTVL